MSRNSSIICKEQVPDENPSDLCLGLQPGKVEKSGIRASMEENTLRGMPNGKGIVQHQGEQYAEECWSQDAACFTPLTMENGTEVEPSNWTVLFI